MTGAPLMMTAHQLLEEDDLTRPAEEEEEDEEEEQEQEQEEEQEEQEQEEALHDPGGTAWPCFCSCSCFNVCPCAT